MSKWDKLSMTQRGELMQHYIREGIRNLDDIKNHYNSFQDGGNLYEGRETPTQRLSYQEPQYTALTDAIRSYVNKPVPVGVQQQQTPVQVELRQGWKSAEDIRREQRQQKYEENLINSQHLWNMPGRSYNIVTNPQEAQLSMAANEVNADLIGAVAPGPDLFNLAGKGIKGVKAISSHIDDALLRRFPTSERLARGYKRALIPYEQTRNFVKNFTPDGKKYVEDKLTVKKAITDLDTKFFQYTDDFTKRTGISNVQNSPEYIIGLKKLLNEGAENTPYTLYISSKSSDNTKKMYNQFEDWLQTGKNNRPIMEDISLSLDAKERAMRKRPNWRSIETNTTEFSDLRNLAELRKSGNSSQFIQGMKDAGYIQINPMDNAQIFMQTVRMPKRDATKVLNYSMNRMGSSPVIRGQDRATWFMPNNYRVFRPNVFQSNYFAPAAWTLSGKLANKYYDR